MTIRDLSIKIDLEVSTAGLAKVNADIDRLINKMQSFDDEIIIRIDADTSGATAKITSIEQQLDRLNDHKIDIDISSSGETKIRQLEEQLESLDELVDIDIRVDTAAASAEITRLSQQLESLEEVVTIHVDVDTGGAIAQLEALEAYLTTMRTHTINIDVDSGAAMAQLLALQAMLELLRSDHSPPIPPIPPIPPPDIDIDVNLQYEEAMAQLARLTQQIESLDNEDIFIDFDVASAQAELLSLRALIQTLEQNIDLDVNTAGAHAKLALLQAHLLSILNPPDIDPPDPGGGGGFLSNLFGSLKLLPAHPVVKIGVELAMIGAKVYILVQALQVLSSVAMVAVGAVGTLGVALGVLGSGALALVGSIGVAAMGIGGVAAMVVPNIMKLYDENVKLNKLQKETKTHIKSLGSAWDGFTNRTQATALDLTSHGVNVLKTSLTMLEPVITSGANAMDILMHNLDRSLQGERMTAFFDSMKRQIPQMTEWIGNGLGNIGQTAANLMTAFEPLTMWMGQGFQNMMGRMADWSFDLQGSDKLKNFIEYIKTNLPLLGSGLGDAITGVTKWFAGFGDTASKGIKWFADTMKEFDTWASNLDTNDGFQKMLTDIETMAPKVADAIGLISESVMTLIDKFAGGSGLDNFVSLLEGINNTLNGDNRIGDFLFGDHKEEMPLPKNTSAGALIAKGALKAGGAFSKWLFGDNTGSTLEERGIVVTADTSQVTQSIDGATKGPFDVGAKVDELLPPMQLKPFEVEAEVNELKPPMMLDDIEVPAKVEELKPPMQIDEIEVPAVMDSIKPPTQVTPMDISAEVKEVKPPMQISPLHMPATVDEVETPPTLPTMELAAKVNTIEPPSSGIAPTLEAPMRVTEVKTPPTLPTMELAAKVNTIEKPPMRAMPTIEAPMRVTTVEKPPTLPTMELAAKVNTIERPPIGAMPALEAPMRVTNVEAPRTLPTVDLSGRVNNVTPPSSGMLPPLDIPASVTRVDTPASLPAVDLPAHVSRIDTPAALPSLDLKAKVTNIEPPPQRAVSLPVKASSVDTSGLPAVRMPLSLSGTNPLNNFKWPPMPTFTFPSLPAFSWPAMPSFSWPAMPSFSWPALPKWSWPALPKWSWPALPKFSWPPMPKFSWPPMPSVTVNVKGADGSHSSGLGRVPFDGCRRYSRR